MKSPSNSHGGQTHNKYQKVEHVLISFLIYEKKTQIYFLFCQHFTCSLLGPALEKSPKEKNSGYWEGGHKWQTAISTKTFPSTQYVYSDFFVSIIGRIFSYSQLWHVNCMMSCVLFLCMPCLPWWAGCVQNWTWLRTRTSCQQSSAW